MHLGSENGPKFQGKYDEISRDLAQLYTPSKYPIGKKEFAQLLDELAAKT